MRVQDMHGATDCGTASTDWTAVGTRILHAAALAETLHLLEQTAEDSGINVYNDGICSLQGLSGGQAYQPNRG
jgi:hypothetical protein